MIAKFSGKCKVTNKPIVAGVTEIVKIGGVWQVATEATGKPAGATIAMAWSQSEQDRWGDEQLQHYASFGDDDGEPVGKIWRCSSRDAAIEMAEGWLYQYNLADMINETMW